MGAVFRRLLVLFLFAFWGIPLGLCQASETVRLDIISPIPGTWGNRQPLVLNVPDGWEAYYSVSGSDPLLFGFAYDGPSLIDQEGDVRLKITALDKTGRRYDYGVDYSVKKFSKLDPAGRWSDAQRKFVLTISMNPVRKYTAGSVFSVPEGFSYTASSDISSGDVRFFKAALLSLTEDSSVIRFVPFVMTDGQDFFRFIVRTVPAKDGREDYTDMPFRFSDWETVMPLDASYVLRIDDGPWQGKPSVLRVDRSETHVLFWKQAGTDDGTAQNLVLYPRPSLSCKVRNDGSCLFSLELEAPYLSGYTLGKSESPSALFPATGLHQSLVLDAFPGEDIAGNFTCGVYLEGVYQGEISAPYHVDRMPPRPPKIIAAKLTGLDFADSREVRVESEPGARIFSAYSEALTQGGPDFSAADYKILAGNSMFLPAAGDASMTYRVSAYAVDAAGNAGEKQETTVTVDGRNVYVKAPDSARTSATDTDTGNGSSEAPFASFERAVQAVNSNEGLTVHIEGNVIVRSDIVLTKRCAVEAGRGCLTFEGNASLSVEGTDVAFKDCTILAGSMNDRENSSFIMARDARVSFDGCDVSANFVREGKLITLSYSALTAKSSSFSATASSYATLVDSHASRVEIDSSTCALSAYTSVAFCMIGCDLRMRNSVIGVSCYTGRVAEISGGSFIMDGNIMTGAIRAEGGMWKLPAVRISGGAKELSSVSNKIRGFIKW